MKKNKFLFGAALILLAFIIENCDSSSSMFRSKRNSCPSYGGGGYTSANAPVTGWNYNGSDLFSTATEYSDGQVNTESYAQVAENKFIFSEEEPVSTFSADVDRASYSNIRRYLTSGQKPPADAVRIEEMINYFHYDYPQPEGTDPIKIITELTECPWNEGNQLLMVGMQAKKIAYQNLPASNLVFLIDVSGSMESEDKLPLLKSSFKLLLEKLQAKDKISIVVYAGAAGLVLPPTAGNQKRKILRALRKLKAGGSTAGGDGIKLAYKTAEENFIKGGNNRIILATDGDFNVGCSSNEEMEKLITEKRNSGVYLTCLGFGDDNIQDDKMEILADKGNGNYSYIDNIDEAKKVLVNEFGGTMYAIAKDVKIQIQFNSENVKAYRLIGYENRMLTKKDFTDDKKDAGDVGSGHSVTAIYEIIPTGVKSAYVKDEQGVKRKNVSGLVKMDKVDMGMVKLRYKPITDSVSKEIVLTVNKVPLKFENTSENLRFASSVALSGMILKNSSYVGRGKMEEVLAVANKVNINDDGGKRKEFISLMGNYK